MSLVFITVLTDHDGKTTNKFQYGPIYGDPD